MNTLKGYTRVFFARISVIFQKGSPFRRRVVAGVQRFRQLIDLERPEAWLQTVSSILLRVGAILLFLGLLAFLWRSLHYEGYTIQSFNVPKVLQDNGYDGIVIARQIEDEYLRIKQDAVSIKEDSVQAVGDEQQLELNLDVLGVGFSLKSIGFYLRDLLGRKNNLIRGEITRADSTLALTLRMTGAQPETIFQSLNGGYQQAINGLLTGAAKMVLKNTDPYRLALYYTHQGEQNLAIHTARQMLIDRPSERHWAYLVWGAALEKKAETEEALKKFDLCIQSKNDFLLGWVRKGSLLLEMGRFEEALPIMEEVVKRKPDEGNYWNSYAYLLYLLERYDESDAAYRKADDYTDQNYYLFNWADKKANLGKYDEAAEILEEAIQKARRGNDLLGEMDAKLYKAMLARDTATIRQYASLKIELDPEDPLTIQMTTAALFRSKMYRDAINAGRRSRWFNRSVEEMQSTLNLVAMSFNFIGRPDSGLVYAREAIAADTTNGLLFTTLAESYHYLGDRDRFFHFLETAFRKGTSTDVIGPTDAPYDVYWNNPDFQALLEKYRK